MAKQKKAKAIKETYHIVPNELNANIKGTIGVTDNMLATQATQELNMNRKSSAKKQTWEDLAAVGMSIAEYIATTAGAIHESVELVKQVGCDHTKEFVATVNKTNEDFNKFLTDYEKVKAKHEGKTGVIKKPEDVALSLRIFEDYQQLYAFFTGVMHHTQIAMTEYALEAKDRLQKQIQDEEAKEKEAQKETAQ